MRICRIIYSILKAMSYEYIVFALFRKISFKNVELPKTGVLKEKELRIDRDVFEALRT